ncbi:GAF domain-containing protein [Polaromonas jejuensis]|uniref:histidine kinase n=1 Tax=Polaromonas jejuensis TaxID=457502 RepID=A0ABW0QB09_9BURK
MLLALLPVFGLLAYSASQSRKTAFQLAESSLQSQALLVAAHQQRLVDMTHELLNGVASATYVKSVAPALCGQHLKNLLAEHPEFTNLGVAGLDGQLVCDARGIGRQAQVGDRLYFRQVLEGRSFAVGRYAAEPRSGLPGLGFAVPVHNPAGQLGGVAFAVLGLPGLSTPLGSLPISLPGLDLAVLDGQGTVLAAHPAQPSWLGRPHPDAAVQRAVQMRQPGVLNAEDAEAVQRIYAFAPVPGGEGQGLFAALRMPHELVAAQSRDTLAIELLALLGMMLFGVACAWWMGNRLIVNPARAILKEANEVAAGNLAARIRLGPLYQGEFGEIGRSFNRMAGSLQARQDELDAALRHACKEQAWLDLILNSMSEGVIATDAEGRIQLFNASARQLYVAPEIGSLLEDWRGNHELRRLDGSPLHPGSARPLQKALRGTRIDNQEVLLCRPGAEDRILSMSTRPLRDADQQVLGGVAVFNDITERKAAESFALAQEQVLTLIAGGGPLSQSLDAIGRLIEQSTPLNLCSILLVDGQQLRHGAAPSLPERIVQALDGLPIGDGAGACGTAAFRKAPVVVEDSECDPLMRDDRELLREHDLRACWSAPVIAGDGEVLATFAMYRRHPGKPEARDLALIATATRLARIALERARAEAALVRTHRALQMLSRSSMAMNRMEDEARLLAEVCRVAVEVGGYRLAWVGYARDDARKSIEPMAHAGDERGYLAALQLSWREDPETGLGPAGRAIRTGEPQHIGDVSRGDRHFHRPELALQRGFRRAICLPLREGSSSFGVLYLYAGEMQHFHADEVKLLQELADNLAFGISSLRARGERHRSREAARLAAIKLGEQASLLDRAQDAIMVRNLDGTLRFWNRGAERLYGWTAEEVLGKTMAEAMYRDPQELTAAMRQTLGNDWTGEREQLARDGSVVFVEMRSTAVRDEQGQVNGVMSINTDIRERKRAHEEILSLNAGLEERVRQRTAQLEFANKQLESFSYSVSHDLRTPLSAIDGFSDLLEKTMAKADPGPLVERGRHYLARIRAGVSQMGELIDAMLSLAQVSRSSLRWEPVDLSAQAAALLSAYQEREPGRLVRLHVEAGLVAQGDPRLLHLVLDNLLGNAWKFSAGQDCAEISLAHETGSAGETIFFVRDNGAGFDMAYAEKLFGPFQRLHSQSEFAGTGIGLATVHRIIERHGGRIWSESAPGKGATFYFTLGLSRL